MVIAIFYTKPFYGLIFYALGTMLILFVLNRMKVKNLFLTFWWGYYVVVYVALWNSRHCRSIISLCYTVWKRRQRLYLICFATFSA
jgi:Na+/H+ antiporter NhaA